MHVLHATVRGTDESREMVVVLRMLLSLSVSLSPSLWFFYLFSSVCFDLVGVLNQFICFCKLLYGLEILL